MLQGFDPIKLQCFPVEVTSAGSNRKRAYSLLRRGNGRLDSSQGDPFCLPHPEQKNSAEDNCISESHSLIQKQLPSAAEFYIRCILLILIDMI